MVNFVCSYTHVYRCPWSQKRVSDLLELEFLVVVSCLMCDESHTRVLCRSRTLSNPSVCPSKHETELPS